jgi:hypothetical protein
MIQVPLRVESEETAILQGSHEVTSRVQKGDYTVWASPHQFQALHERAQRSALADLGK